MKPQYNLLFIAVLVAMFVADTACTTVTQFVLVSTLGFFGLVGSLYLRDLSTNKR